MNYDTLKFRMGVSDAIVVNTGHSPEAFLAGIRRALRGYQGPCDLDIIIKSVETWNCLPLFDLLKICETSINTQSEVAARIIIDPWIISGMHIINTMTAVHVNYRPILFPELHVWSTRSQSDPPAIIKYKDIMTYLSGSIDYVSINYHLLNEDDTKGVERIIGVNKVMNGENAARALRVFTHADTFTIYEAKRRSKRLYDHEPQVVAECLALLSKVKAGNPTFSTTKVGFTLTTGLVWIFGLVDTQNRKYSKTTEIKINVKELNTDGKVYQSLRALMTIMLIWGTQSGDVLEIIMTALASSTSHVNSSA